MGRSRTITERRVIKAFQRSLNDSNASEDKVKTVETLNLSGLGADGVDPKALADFSKLKRLNLRNNELEGSLFDLFESLSCVSSTLTYLDVSENKLSSLEGSSDVVFSQLISLKLSSNALTGEFDLSAALTSLPALKVLLLDRNDLRDELTMSMVHANLNVLVISHNPRLTDVRIRKCVGLVKLNASFCGLRTFPTCSDTLEEIRLVKNSTLILPFGFDKTQFKTCDVSGCVLGDEDGGAIARVHAQQKKRPRIQEEEVARVEPEKAFVSTAKKETTEDAAINVVIEDEGFSFS